MISTIAISSAGYYFLLPGLFLVAGIYDVLTGRIPDWISLVLVAAFVAMSLIAGKNLTVFGLHCAVALAVFFAGFLAFDWGLMGGGDGKLAAAGALWFGPTLTVDFFVAAFIYGGVMAIAVSALRSVQIPAFVTRQPWAMRWLAGQEGLPFGLAMAASVLTLREFLPLSLLQ